MKTVCVFCGSQSGSNPIYAASARELGRELVRRGQVPVYGGGRVGLMGELATAVLEAGGGGGGVVPHGLSAEESAFPGGGELIVVGTKDARAAAVGGPGGPF